jgi:hypothetical protein
MPGALPVQEAQDRGAGRGDARAMRRIARVRAAVGVPDERRVDAWQRDRGEKRDRRDGKADDATRAHSEQASPAGRVNLSGGRPTRSFG